MANNTSPLASNVYKARVDYTVTDVSATSYSFPFSYLRKQFIKVRVIKEDKTQTDLTYGVDYTVDSLSIVLTGTVQLVAKDTLVIYRNTDTTSIITWTDASILLSKDMTIEQTQMLHIIEEQQDFLTLSTLHSSTDDRGIPIWDAMGNRITNVKDPEDDHDAATKGYILGLQDGFVNQNKELLQQAIQAKTDAAESAKTAWTYRDLAKGWAVSTTSPDDGKDTSSPTGKTQSSRSWAMTAKAYAEQAQGSSGLADFKGATETTDGVHGLVPKPTKGNQNAVLRGDGTWGTLNTFNGGEAGLVPSATNEDYDSVLLGDGTWGSAFPEGSVLKYTGTTAPKGWLICDGSAISRTLYAGLYVIMGTKYGTGDGKTTFNIPTLAQLQPSVTGSEKYVFIIKATASDKIPVKILQSLHQTITVKAGGKTYTNDFQVPAGTDYEASVTPDEGYLAGELKVTDI